MSVQKKLHNEKFMAGAPEQVVLVERKKEADAFLIKCLLEDAKASKLAEKEKKKALKLAEKEKEKALKLAEKEKKKK